MPENGAAVATVRNRFVEIFAVTRIANQNSEGKQSGSKQAPTVCGKENISGRKVSSGLIAPFECIGGSEPTTTVGVWVIFLCGPGVSPEVDHQTTAIFFFYEDGDNGNEI